MSDVKKRISTTFCLFCMQDFGTYTRMYNHLYKSSRCKHLYLLSVDPLADHEVECIWGNEKLKHRELKKAGWRHHKAVLPAMRLDGPLLECACAD
eukprot:9974506-Karenia_brevis.AAC.1